MKIVVVEPFKEPRVEECDGKLESMQEIVGGLIETFPTFEQDDAIIICNEEGKMLDLPLNRAVMDENGEVMDIIAGTFFICKASKNSDMLEGLDEDLIKKYIKKYSIHKNECQFLLQMIRKFLR